MRAKNRSKWLALGFLTLLTSFPVFVGVYFADPGNTVFFQRVAETAARADFKKASRIFQDKVLLLKDSSVTVNNTRLIYKGLEDRRILLEYYLLELDPQTPYRNKISKADAGDGFRLGDSVFQLVSVSRTVLKLRIDTVCMPN